MDNAARAQPRATLTRLTSDAPIGKAYELDASGALVSASRAAFVSGRAERCEVATVAELAELIRGLTDRQALAFGVTAQPVATVTTKKRLPTTPGAIARERESFAWPSGPGILFLDVDADHGGTRYETAPALHSVLARAVPALRDAPALVIPSSSAGIVSRESGAVLRPPGSWHVYLLVRDATDVERCGRAIFDRLWLAGFGRTVASKSGRALVRGLIDASVWQPERLDFAGPVRCAVGLARRPPDSALFNADAEFLDTRTIRDLSDDERAQLERLRADSREAIAADLEAAASEWDAAYARDRLAARPEDVKPDEWERRAYREARDAREHGRLPPSLVLYPEDGEPVTVADVLRDPSAWDGQRFADPLEPDYRRDPRVAVFFANPGTRPQLYSHAHGGRSYALGAERVPLRVVAGDAPFLADEALGVIRDRGELYDFGDRALVRVTGGRSVEVSETWLADYLARECLFRRFDKRVKEWLPCNVPPNLPQTILARSGDRGLKKLAGIVTQPTMRPDGSIVDAPGYDAQTGLLLVVNGATLPRIPPSPTPDDARRALAILWQPFGGFPFDGPVSQAVALAAILTAAVRPALPTAPAFAFDAPAAGTGKTLFASCLAEIRGERAAVTSPPRDDAEMSKYLTAALLGGAPVLVLDNWTATIDGNAFPALCAAITGAELVGRILGRSETARLPNRALIALTGNNLTLAADMVRRVCVARLDAKLDRPELRRFDFDPAAYVRRHRASLIAAALTLLRAYQVNRASINDVFGPPAVDAFGSFEAWDALVRQAVVWIGQPQAVGGLGVPGIGDPAASSAASAVADPARNALAAMLQACRDKFGPHRFTVADVLRVDFGNGALETALSLAFDGQRASGIALGRWLARNRGAVADGLRFESERDPRTKSQRWRVAECK